MSNLTKVGTARPNFVEKTFAGGSKTVKIMNLLSLRISVARPTTPLLFTMFRERTTWKL